MFEICLVFDGKQHCFSIPVLIDPFPHRPDPETIRRGDPLIEELAALSTIARVLPAVKDTGVRRNIQELVTARFEAVIPTKELPQGVSVNLSVNR